MATFVLVHGAWEGGSVWRGVARRLRAAGHEVYAPSLTGLGARRHLLAPEVGLGTHIEDVLGLIDEEELSGSSSAIPMAAWSSPATPCRAATSSRSTCPTS